MTNDPGRWEDAVDSMDPVERLRVICLALPETTERLSHGEPTWFVREKESLVADDPEHFFRPPYVGHRGWLGVYLDIEGVDWDHLEEIVEDAYRMVAPKKLLAELDARGSDSS